MSFCHDARGPRAKRGEDGFSLLEMLVAVTLIGISISVAAFAYGRMFHAAAVTNYFDSTRHLRDPLTTETARQIQAMVGPSLASGHPDCNFGTKLFDQINAHVDTSLALALPNFTDSGAPDYVPHLVPNSKHPFLRECQKITPSKIVAGEVHTCGRVTFHDDDPVCNLPKKDRSPDKICFADRYPVILVMTKTAFRDFKNNHAISCDGGEGASSGAGFVTRYWVYYATTAGAGFRDDGIEGETFGG